MVSRSLFISIFISLSVVFLALWVRVPRALSDSSAARSVASIKITSDQYTLNMPSNLKWAKSRGRECIRKGRYRRFCQGPRRVPKPHGRDALRAVQLGLGQVKTVSLLMLEPPKPRWTAAAGIHSGDKKLLWPVPGGKLWRGFGKVKRGSKGRRRWHKGVDIGAPKGTPFFAVENGLVAYSDNEVRGFGNMMALVHPDASVTFYTHAKALYYFAGQRVKRGQVIGEVGHTGIARGSHLHFEYRVKGRPRNPIKRFDAVEYP